MRATDNKILSELKKVGSEGLPKTTILGLFSRHVKRASLSNALNRLLRGNLIFVKYIKTKGRPETRYYHQDAFNILKLITSSTYGKFVDKDEQVGGAVNHPSHYNAHPAGIECIDVVEWMSFNIGNCVKYCWRSGLKGSKIEDLKKACWYLKREIAKLEKEAQKKPNEERLPPIAQKKRKT